MQEDMPKEFDHVRRSYYEARCETAVKALNKRWFDAKWFSTAERAVEAVLELIPAGSKVGAGGSVTIWETGLMDMLAERGDTLVYHRPELRGGAGMYAGSSFLICPEIFDLMRQLISSKINTKPIILFPSILMVEPIMSTCLFIPSFVTNTVLTARP